MRSKHHGSEQGGNRRDEEFAELVSDALFVPDAAPEIRMIAEVMASMSIPSSRYDVVTDIHRGTRRFGAKAVACAAAALAIVGVAVSAYAGVLPASIQDVAHHVIDAPSAHHNHGNVRAPGTGGDSPGDKGSPAQAPTSSRAQNGPQDRTTTGGTPSNSEHTAPGSTPSDTSSHARGNNGHHKGGPPATATAVPTQPPAPAPTSQATGSPAPTR